MAIDAVIDAVKRKPDVTELWLRARIGRDRRATIAGRRHLFIGKNPDYEPQPGDEIWGGSGFVVISKGGVDHRFERIVMTARRK